LSATPVRTPPSIVPPPPAKINAVGYTAAGRSTSAAVESPDTAQSVGKQTHLDSFLRVHHEHIFFMISSLF
jgi:hypothetical protein